MVYDIENRQHQTYRNSNTNFVGACLIKIPQNAVRYSQYESIPTYISNLDKNHKGKLKLD